jgi:uncharacterized protein (UPF0276 family)
MPLPELGVGVIYTPALQPLLEAEADLISVVEVEPETLWTFAADPAAPYRPDWSALERVRGLPQTKLIHGVGFPVGGSRVPDPLHLPLLVEMIDFLGAPWASEHLAFNRAAGPDGPFATGFLLPPLQSTAGIAAAEASIRSVAAHLPVPFAVETGVNYLQPRAGEISDGAFVAAVAEAADCGIVLDLHNLWANERNGRQGIEDLLGEIPRERVWEVHIAGGSEFLGYWLDAHSGEVPGDLLSIARRILPELPELRAVVFEITATFLTRLGLDGVRRQLVALREIWEQRAAALRLAGLRRPDPSPLPEMTCGEPAWTPGEWEDGLAALVVGSPSARSASPVCLALAEDPGIEVLRRLIWNFRSGVLVETLGLTCRLLLLHGGDPFIRELFDDFFLSAPPELFASVEAEAFGAYLARRRPDVPFLEEVLGFDLAALRAVLQGTPQVVPFRFEPASLLDPLSCGRLPESPTPGRFEVEVTPDAGSGTTAASGLISSS